jgi:hypothetical protein
MSEKTRRSVAYSGPQMKFLEREAARLGIKVSELLRRIVDQYREAMKGKFNA